MADVLTIVDGGKNYFNDLVTARSTAENIEIGLFVNDATITSTTVMGDLTVMSTHGIGTETLSGTSWPASSIVGDQATSAYDARDFEATAADDGTVTNVYGYFARNLTSGVLLWAVKFDSAKPITYESEKITVVPEMRYGQKA